jgi:hypothetical protein
MSNSLWIARLACAAGLGLGLAAGCESRQQTDKPVGVTLTREYSDVANTVDVTLDVGRIAMPEIIGSGWTSFVVRNNDRVAHVFILRGNGIERTLDRIEPGQMQTMRVELQPGTYEIYCADCAADTTGITRQLIVAKW